MTIEIVRKGNPVFEIIGYVDGREVLILSKRIQDTWTVGSSTCLSSDIHKSREMVDCYYQAFNLMDHLR